MLKNLPTLKREEPIFAYTEAEKAEDYMAEEVRFELTKGLLPC